MRRLPGVRLRFEQCANGLEDFLNLSIVLPKSPLQFFEPLGQFMVRCKNFTELDESPHDGDIHLHRAFALQNAR